MNASELDDLIDALDPVSAQVSSAIDARRDDVWRVIEVVMGTPRRRRRNSRLVVSVVAATVCAAAALVGLVPGSTTRSAAATALNRAAQEDAQSAILPTLASGQYYYQSSVVSQTCAFTGLATTSDPNPQWIDFVTTGSRETWTGADGTGDVRVSPNPTGVDGSGFATPQDEALWNAEGRPNNFCEQADPSTNNTRPSGGSLAGYGGFGYLLTVAADTQLAAGTSVNNLPTDVSTLTQLLASGEIDTDGSVASSPQPCPVGSSSSTSPSGCSVEEQAELITQLLQLPDASAKLGSVLYEVLSQLPGSQIVGPATNAYGQVGTEITEPLGVGELLKVVVNTSSGALLETEVTSPAISGQPDALPLDVKASYGTIEVVNGSGVQPSVRSAPR